MTSAFFRNDVRISGIKPFGATYMTVAGVTVVFFLLSTAVVFGAKNHLGPRSLLPRLGWLALVTATAVLCQIADHPGHFLYRPDGAVQGHAIWHGLMALAAALAYDLFSIIGGEATIWRPVT